MTSKNRNEVKPVQVSVKEVRSWRREDLIGGIAGLIFCLLLTSVAIRFVVMSGSWVSIAVAILVSGIVFFCARIAFSMLRDYKKSAWMTAFWEDD